jgi:Family of unknown function (DUF5691)
VSWSELVNAALIGAGRATVPTASPILESMDLGAADERVRLLNHAAAMSRARRAGYRPEPAASRPAPGPAEPDDRPPVSLAAELQLAELLASWQLDLAAEWLRLLAATARRPPDSLLPALLTAAAAHPELRGQLMPVLGPLARWLAGFNAEWRWLQGQSDTEPELWETGDIETRRAILARVRADDPAAGRELVEATWSADAHRERALFVAALAVGLGPDDEPFLERALADRRAEVRRAAADQLARLPGSRFARRAARQATTAVAVRRGAHGRQLVIMPLPADDPGLASARLARNSSSSAAPAGAGRRAWRLQQIVGAAAAGIWTAHTGLPPADLLALATRTDWARPLRAGWAEAAVRDANLPWLEALLDRAEAAEVARLLPALPAHGRDEWLAAHPGYLLFDGVAELAAAPWSARLSDQVRVTLTRILRADPGYSPGPRALIRLAGLRLEPPAPPRMEPAEVHERLRNPWNDLLTTLSTRAAMRRELAEEPIP